MAAKKRGLGRGLDALLGAQPNANKQDDSQVASETETVAKQDNELKHLPIEFLQRGQYQPRRDMDQEALEDLAASIKAQGVMQPIVVRQVGLNKYEIIAGERRWRASQLAEMDTVPVLIREVPDEAAIAMALIENIQREDLNPMEEAIALQRLQQEFELTQQAVADAVGKSRVTITNLLRLMNLNEDVKRLLEHGDIELGHAKVLLGLDGNKQSEAARQIVAKSMTVRQAEALIKSIQNPIEKKKTPKDPDIKRLENTLADKLGANVAIQHGNGGKGKLVINYSSLEQLDGILGHIK